MSIREGCNSTQAPQILVNFIFLSLHTFSSIALITLDCLNLARFNHHSLTLSKLASLAPILYGWLTVVGPGSISLRNIPGRKRDMILIPWLGTKVYLHPTTAPKDLTNQKVSHCRHVSSSLSSAEEFSSTASLEAGWWRDGDVGCRRVKH